MRKIPFYCMDAGSVSVPVRRTILFVVPALPISLASSDPIRYPEPRTSLPGECRMPTVFVNSLFESISHVLIILVITMTVLVGAIMHDRYVYWIPTVPAWEEETTASGGVSAQHRSESCFPLSHTPPFPSCIIIGPRTPPVSSTFSRMQRYVCFQVCLDRNENDGKSLLLARQHLRTWCWSRFARQVLYYDQARCCRWGPRAKRSTCLSTKDLLL
jgi:hypothetical protein